MQKTRNHITHAQPDQQMTESYLVHRAAATIMIAAAAVIMVVTVAVSVPPPPLTLSVQGVHDEARSQNAQPARRKMDTL